MRTPTAREGSLRPARRRRTLLPVLAVALAALVPAAVGAPVARVAAVESSELDDLQDEIRSTDERREREQAALALTESDIRAAGEELALIERRLADAEDNLRVAEGQLALGRNAAAEAEAARQVAERSLTTATAMLTAAEQALEAEEELLASQLTSTYKYGSQRGSLAVRVITQVRRPNQFAHRLYQLQSVLDWQQSAVDRVDDLREERAELTVQAAEAHDVAVRSRRDAAAALEFVERLAEQARDLEAAVRADRSRQEQVLASLEDSAATKRAVLSSLAVQREELSAELARKRAAAQARDGVICPNPIGTAWFQNDWGFPRSGGRTHKGTDVFAARNTPLYAMAAGTVRKVDHTDVYKVGTGRGDLGGITVSITIAPNEYWYFAHLEGIAPGLSVGDHVASGQLIGWVGNSGNARTTPTHTHIGRYVNGRAVNPFPTLDSVCR